MPINTVESMAERESEMSYGSRYYPDRFNPYNRHDTGIYCCYRKSDNKYVGSVVDCRSESEAKRKALYEFGFECYVSEVEE